MLAKGGDRPEDVIGSDYIMGAVRLAERFDRAPRPAAPPLEVSRGRR